MWDCWAVVVGILPLVCSDNDVGVVGLVLSTVVLISSPFLWGNVLESQGATTLREFTMRGEGSLVPATLVSASDSSVSGWGRSCLALVVSDHTGTSMRNVLL